jgi:hypothetical protein
MNAHHASTIDHRPSLIDHRQSPTIELHIDELVLEGFPMLDRERLGGAIRTELARLLTEQGAPSLLNQSGEIMNLPGGTLTAGQTADATALGVQIAHAIYVGLNR